MLYDWARDQLMARMEIVESSVKKACNNAKEVTARMRPFLKLRSKVTKGFDPDFDFAEKISAITRTESNRTESTVMERCEFMDVIMRNYLYSTVLLEWQDAG